MKDKFLSLLKRFGKAFWGSLSHNLGLKLLSLFYTELNVSYVPAVNDVVLRQLQSRCEFLVSLQIA